MAKLFALMTILALASVASAQQTFLNEESTTAPDEDLKNHWAVLVAGSKGYFNYRHHADLCHAYHLLIRQGVPASQIIVMAYNDVPWEYENPFLGKLYNSHSEKDWYEGCKMDYTGADVTADNFMAILRGEEIALNLSQDSNATRKVLKSDEQSKVFLSFFDHGAPGNLMFPDSYLYADQLNDTIQTMHEKNMYDEFIIFIEACESGSLFVDIDLESMNVWALTATNATNPSFGTYCYPHDKIQGSHMYTCLGDLFSVSWMEYLELNERKLRDLTLKQLYHEIKERTSVKSNVQNFGDQNITNQAVETVFLQDNETEKQPNLYERFTGYLKNGLKKPDEKTKESEKMFYSNQGKLVDSKVSSREIQLHHLYHKSLDKADSKLKQKLMNEITKMSAVEQIFASFLDTTVDNLEICRDGTQEACQKEWIPKDFKCLRSLMDTYRSSCGPIPEYANNFIKYFVQQCEQPKIPLAEAHIRLQNACSQQ